MSSTLSKLSLDGLRSTSFSSRHVQGCHQVKKCGARSYSGVLRRRAQRVQGSFCVSNGCRNFEKNIRILPPGVTYDPRPPVKGHWICIDLGNNLRWSPNSTWLDTFDVSSPCILAVSNLSNSTARHVTWREVECGLKSGVDAPGHVPRGNRIPRPEKEVILLHCFGSANGKESCRQGGKTTSLNEHGRGDTIWTVVAPYPVSGQRHM